VEQKRLRLVEFKVLFNVWRRYVVVFDNLLLGFLSWCEQILIDNRVKTEVDMAVEQYNKKIVSYDDSPVIVESSSETSERLSSVRITAPWYIDMYDER
jgi:hypothetical protein